MHIFTRTYNLCPWKFAAGRKNLVPQQPTNILCFVGPLVISKNLISYLKFFVRYCNLKNPAF